MNTGPDPGRFDWPLLDGERIVWSGVPRQGWIVSGRDAFLIPFSLLWGGFAVFWESIVLRSRAPLFFSLWGIPFLLAGVYLIIGRFAADAWLRGKIRYALTDRRILIDRSGPWSSFTALSLDRLPEVQLTPQGGGRGTIRFGQAAGALWAWGGRGGFGMWSPALDPTPQFIGIEDAQAVFDRIQRSVRVNR